MKRFFGIRTVLLIVVFLVAALTSISWMLPPTYLAQTDQTYILTAARWDTQQINAVNAAGGTVIFGHDQSGIGMATSSAPDFLERVLASNAITGAAVDQAVQWLPPNEQVVETAVTPA